MNRAPIGHPYAVGDRVFCADTPRCVLADAIQDVGRNWEAELLRCDSPIVLAQTIRMPHARDVAAEVTRLLPWMLSDGGSFFGMSSAEHDMIIWVAADGDPMTTPAWLFRWRAADTAAVYSALRRAPAAADVFVPHVLAAVTAAGVEIEYTPVF
jgi:hypothetical protein